jgi:hypothetical protein
MFSFDDSGIKKFIRELQKIPELHKKAVAATLNDQAFKFKTEAGNVIIENYVSRRPDFVRRQMRVSKANPHSLEAIAGSVGIDNNPSFSGFTEFLGQQDQRVRSPTLAGRGGAAQNILPKANRLMPDVNIPDVAEMPYGLPVAALLDMLHRQGQKSFIIKDPKFAPGLYTFDKGKEYKRGKPKIKMVQSFKKPKQPRRFNWVNAALSKITEAWIQTQHIKNIDFEVKKRLKKVFR